MSLFKLTALAVGIFVAFYLAVLWALNGGFVPAIVVLTSAVYSGTCAAFTATVAGQKGYDSRTWGFGGFFCGIIALIAACGLPDRDGRSSVGPTEHNAATASTSGTVGNTVEEGSANTVSRTEGRLTKEIAEQFLEDAGSVHLNEFTELDDEAAESLGEYQGSHLFLDGLTSLSDTAVESLSKHQGEGLFLDGLTSLSDSAAESLVKYKGRLHLNLDELPSSAAEILRQHPNFQGE